MSAYFFYSKNEEKKNRGVIRLSKPLAFDFSTISEDAIHYILKMEGVSPLGEEIKVKNQYLEKDGQPWLPSYGELQFSRYPDSHWEDAILKMKSAGFYGISTHIYIGFITKKKKVILIGLDDIILESFYNCAKSTI